MTKYRNKYEWSSFLLDTSKQQTLQNPFFMIYNPVIYHWIYLENATNEFS